MPPAMVSGLVSEVPSVKVGAICLSGTVTPICRASLIGSQSPVRCSSWAKKVFTDSWVPV